jgi:hypothetical protein
MRLQKDTLFTILSFYNVPYSRENFQSGMPRPFTEDDCEERAENDVQRDGRAACGVVKANGPSSRLVDG